MATYATLTINAEDIIGADFDKSRANAVIEFGGDDGVIDAIKVDNTTIRLGSRRENPDATGLFTFANLVTTNTASNPVTFYYRVTITYVPKGSRRQGHDQWQSGWFPLTATANAASIDEFWDNVAAPVTWRSGFRDEMNVIADVAASSATSAAASADIAGAIAGADTADDLITILDADAGSDFRAQQDARLAATYGPETGAAPGVPDAFIANGIGNTVTRVTERATDPLASHVEGFENRALGWYAHAEGAGCIVDGKIAHAEGNAVICTANDAHAEGNRTVAGRRYYGALVGSAVTTGSEDAGSGLGVLQYVLIPADEGDVTSYFPNALTDTVTTRYGAGAQKDAVGNIYPTGMTPATWAGDTVTTANDLQWAMHRVAIVRGSAEDELAFVTIEKATWTGGVGTKVYYRGAKPFTTLIGIYTSYAPTVFVSGVPGGNGTHAEGFATTAVGYGAHAEGWGTRAHNDGTHAEGRLSKATGTYAHAEGFATLASGASGSHAEGESTLASGQNAHAEGYQVTASGATSHAEGYQTYATGNYSHAQGEGSKAIGSRSHAEGFYTEATGDMSRATGRDSNAVRPYQESHSSGKRTALGDHQVSRIVYGKSCVDAGWHDVPLVNGLVNDRTYLFETTVIGRQTAGGTGAVGDSFAYKFRGAVTVAGGAMTVLGTIERTLVGRTSGMSGDGLTTGARLTAYTSLYPGSGIGNLVLRYDGEAGRTVYISTVTTFHELA